MIRGLIRSALSLAFALTASAALPDDALVVVVSRAPGGGEVGCGFAVGDGSLVVTARHVLLGQSNETLSESLGLITVVSPFLGDLAEGRMVLEDAELDLAVVRVPWAGHPALVVAEDTEVREAREVEVAVPANLMLAVRGEEAVEGGKLAAVTSERLPVNYVGMRGSEPRMLSVRMTGKLRSGWSGSPVLVAGSGRAAGVLISMRGKRPTMIDRAEASALGSVVRASRLNLAPRPAMARPDDANAALKLIAEYRRAAFREDFAAAGRLGEALMAMRPKNSLFVEYVATACEHQKDDARAESLYRKAMDLSPACIETRLLYSQFLRDRDRDEECMALLRAIRADEPRATQWAISMCNILMKKKDHAGCVKLLNEAIAVEPNDAKLWAYLGQSRRDLGQRDEAIKALERAVELDERQVVTRVLLGQELAAAGQLDRAETQFRETVASSPGDVLSHYGLGTFLAEHRPEKLGEAIREIELAAVMPEHPGRPPRQMLLSIVQRLRARAATRAASQPVRPYEPRLKPASIPAGSDLRM